MSAFSAGFVLSMSLIMAIGPQNAHLIRMGLRREHVCLTVIASTLCDIVLIILSLAGLSMLGGLSAQIHQALLSAGTLFLIYYGSKAAYNCHKGLKNNKKVPTKPNAKTSAQDVPKELTRKQALLAVMTFSWLNPHAWVDTAVLIGSASLAYQTPGKAVFGLGAMTGSALWFVTLGSLATWLGRRLDVNRISHWIDGAVALIMFTIAFMLARQLLSI